MPVLKFALIISDVPSCYIYAFIFQSIYKTSCSRSYVAIAFLLLVNLSKGFYTVL